MAGAAHRTRHGQLSRFCKRYLGVRRGAAAAEFALVLLFLVIPLLNLVDVGFYILDRMLVDNASQMAVQTAWATCGVSQSQPATANAYANCPALPSAMTYAAHSTSLGTSVSISSVTENYYCIDPTTSVLTVVGTFPSPKIPTGTLCTAATGDPRYQAATVGDYVLVTATYTYAPLFSGVSVGSLLAGTITRTSWTRLS